jgi:hypothetical protein
VPEEERLRVLPGLGNHHRRIRGTALRKIPHPADGIQRGLAIHRCYINSLPLHSSFPLEIQINQSLLYRSIPFLQYSSTNILQYSTVSPILPDPSSVPSPPRQYLQATSRHSKTIHFSVCLCSASPPPPPSASPSPSPSAAVVWSLVAD